MGTANGEGRPPGLPLGSEAPDGVRAAGGLLEILFGLFIARWLVPWEALGLSAEPSNHFFYVVRQVTFWLFAAAVVFWPEGRRVERDEGRG